MRGTLAAAFCLAGLGFGLYSGSADGETDCSSLDSSWDTSTCAESNPTGADGTPVLPSMVNQGKCAQGTIRVVRIDNNNQKIVRCAKVENCGGSSATTLLCTKKADANCTPTSNGFPTYFCAKKN
jgi:hypothetical protein